MPAPGANNVWNSAHEGNIVGTDPVGEGDNWIRADIGEVRKRLQPEHEFGTGFTGTSGDNGLHRVGSARVFIKTSAPTTLEDGSAPTDHNNTGGAGTATLSANESNRTPTQRVGHGRVHFNPNTRTTKIYNDGTWSETARLPRGFIGGLTISVATSTVTVTAGECRMGTAANRSQTDGQLASTFTKLISATWAAGTGNGGMSTATSPADEWLHVFLIQKPTGETDIGFDTDVDATNLLGNAAVQAAGFTLGSTMFRRLGSVRTNSINTLISVSQMGNHFMWLGSTSLGLDINETGTNFNGSNAFKLQLTFVPPGVKVIPLLGGDATGGLVRILSGDGAINSDPDNNGYPMQNLPVAGPFPHVLTNTNQEISVRSNNAVNIFADLTGYIDFRGQHD